MSTSQDKPTSAPRTTRLVYLVTVIAAIGGFLFGYDTGVISGALLFIEKDFTMSPFVEGVVVSAILVGAFFGAMGCGPLADRLGRRLSILVLAGVFGVGSVLAATAVSVPMLVGDRVALGADRHRPRGTRQTDRPRRDRRSGRRRSPRLARQTDLVSPRTCEQAS